MLFNCFLQVSELKSQLAEAKAQQEKLSIELRSAASARDAAQEREAAQRAIAEQLQFLLDEAHARVDAASSKVSVWCCRGLPG
jgi:hypothetical protein